MVSYAEAFDYLKNQAAARPTIGKAYTAAKAKTAGIAASGKGYPFGTGTVNRLLGSETGKFGKTAQFAAGNWQWILPIIATLLAGKELRKYGERKETAIQTEHVQEMGEQLSSEDMMYQAMMPAVQQEQQMVSQMLMQQLMGNQAPQLANGEERIGGQQRGFPGF